MSETAVAHVLGKTLVAKQELEALVAQYRAEHRAAAALWNGTDECGCALCARAAGLGIAPVNWLLDAEDAVAERGRRQ